MKFKNILWVFWAIYTPLVLYLVFSNTSPLLYENAQDILLFLILMIIVCFFPIIVNETPIFFGQAVLLAVFLSFGLFVEMVVMQLSIVVLLLRLRISKSDLYRYPLNSIMFISISIIGGLVYYSLGGTHGDEIVSLTQIVIPIIGYLVAIFISNQLFLAIIDYVKYKRKIKKSLLSRDMLWEVITTCILIPFGLILFLLYEQLGIQALIYTGLPFICIVTMIQLYNSSRKVNNYLQRASEIGHQLAEQLKVEQVIDLFLEKLTMMFPVDLAYILDVVNDDTLNLIRYYECSEEKKLTIPPLQKYEGIAGEVWASKKPVIYHSRNNWKSVMNGCLPSTVESVMAVPVVRNQTVVSVIVLASHKKRAYKKYQLMLVDLLGSYLAVAIENARHYEEAKHKSEHDGLTKIYNYQYFEGLLSQEMDVLSKKDWYKTLSIILIDIDHFKAVNDTYGHQSGNDILRDTAMLLTEIVGNEGTVARYGGEEFIILLPFYDRQSAFSLAEEIRKKIATRPFHITGNLSDKKVKQVKITASIGIATSPYDGENPIELIRTADRAMYTGAKQAGRNKVAVLAQ
ncbi:sensor domain-containing diguanylate cyclase [Cytobacillus sp. IB215665]|uniref:sensor domain-containing diguanylate cyclase n=1 Tax=Cytobacillus sp. IB215665 TaxID=3097357 RepID=UPI002A180B88|nr:sensor domain-containing diguanylate cyclase [Cytobacillus sp. IB215665]MDX8364047.1 sensor domain-containing diguanylate cyclase [Cytobacillus sp. IB215665]